MTESNKNIKSFVVKRDHISFIERMVIRLIPYWIILFIGIFMWHQQDDKAPLLIINGLLVLLYAIPLLFREKYYLNKIEFYNEKLIFSGTVFFKAHVINVDKNRLKIKKVFSGQRGSESYKLLIYHDNNLIYKVYSLTSSEVSFRKEIYEMMRKYLVNKGIPRSTKSMITKSSSI